MTNRELIKALRNRRVCLQATGSLDDHGLLEEAAKAIESSMKSAQEAWRYASENIPKWIPVSEKLPEIDEPVLLYADDNEIYIGWFSGFEGDGGVPVFENDEYEWDGVVTYWQKLPKFPGFCGSCKHYMGMGDWSLCCDLKHDLCNENTPACEKYEEKTDDE